MLVVAGENPWPLALTGSPVILNILSKFYSLATHLSHADFDFTTSMREKTN